MPGPAAKDIFYLPGAPLLPPGLEAMFLRVLASEPGGGGQMFEQMLARQSELELSLSSGKELLKVRFAPDGNVFLVRLEHRNSNEKSVWYRVRRLALRDVIQSNLSGGHGAIGDLYPLLSKALNFPRPVLKPELEFPALSQLMARCHVQLEQNESVDFFDFTPKERTLSDDPKAIADDMQAHLDNLTGPQIAAMVQDDLFNVDAVLKMPTVFPADQYGQLSALLRHANPLSRPTVSLVLPVEVELRAELGAATVIRRDAQAALVYLDLTVMEVMEAVRSNDLSVPASEALEENGLSLGDLTTRESRGNID